MTSDKEKLWLRQKLREYKVKNSDMKELKKEWILYQFQSH